MKKIILEGLHIKHYSHTDLDGVFPEILTRKIFEFNPRVFQKGSQKYFHIEPNELYGEIEKSISEIKKGECDLVIITDLAFNKKEFSLIQNFGLEDHFLVFDHHISDLFPKYQLAFLNDNITIQVNGFDPYCNKQQICGTSIYYQYLIKCGYINPNELFYESLDSLIELVRLYDTYEFNLPINNDNPMAKEAVKLNTLFHVLGIDLFSQYLIDFKLENYTSVFKGTLKYPYIETLLKNAELEEAKYIEKRVKSAEIKNITVEKHEYNIAVVFAEKCQSEIGKVLYDNGADIAVMVGANHFSLRTKKGSGIDLNKIAKTMGGGGHSESAGFPISKPVTSAIFDTIKQSLRYY